MLLNELERVMRRAGYWQAQAPSPQQLASRQPFCVDTLSLPQWLQFVFVVRVQTLCDSRQQLPLDCAIAPVAEMFFAGAGQKGVAIVQILQKIDACFGASNI